MNDTRKLLEQALDALESCNKELHFELCGEYEPELAAIESLKAALAAQGEKPVSAGIEQIAGAISKHITTSLYQREVLAAAQYIYHRYCTHPDPRIKELEGEASNGALQQWLYEAYALTANQNLRLAADRISELEGEVESLAHQLNRQKQWKDTMRDKMVKLEAERDAALVDARRYRWLRDECAEHHIGVYDYASDDKKRFWLSGAELDAEIDQAMKGEQ